LIFADSAIVFAGEQSPLKLRVVHFKKKYIDAAKKIRELECEVF
jgi:hypothetical protein